MASSKKPAPSTKPLAQRLQAKPGVVLFAPNVPAAVKPLLAGAALTTKAGKTVDAALLFAKDTAALATVFDKVRGKLTPDTLLWIAYPKGGSGVETDLNRDHGWAPVDGAGLRPVAQIAVDATWSALRWRPGTLVRR